MIGPVTGVEVFESAETSADKVQIPSRQPGKTLGCVYHEELKNTHDNFFLQILTIRLLEPRSHRRRRAAGDREHRRQVDSQQSGMKLRRSHSLYLSNSVNDIGIVPSENKTQKEV